MERNYTVTIAGLEQRRAAARAKADQTKRARALRLRKMVRLKKSGKTYGEIGKLLGISKQRVEQILRAAA